MAGGGIAHRSRLRKGGSEGLLAQDVLARRQGGDAGLGMEVGLGAVIHHLHPLVRDEGVPVGVVGSVAVAPGRRGDLVRRASGDGDQVTA